MNNQRLAFSGKRRGSRGFTLIELLVVVGILVVITGVALTSYSKFGGDMLLRNLAYDMALSIREAQVFGISARSFIGADFAVGHGAAFRLTDSNTQFFLYTDRNGDDLYSSAGNEWVETYSIGRGYIIERICVPNGSGGRNCLIENLDILFRRPEPDAIISATDGSGYQSYNRVWIVVMSPQEKRVAVLVETTGQISIQRYEE